MKQFTYTPSECPEHKGEYLEMHTLMIKVRNSDWEGVPLFNYCPTSNKYSDGEKLVSVEEAALNYVNSNKKRRNLLARLFIGKFRLNEIQVQTQEECIKNRKTG